MRATSAWAECNTPAMLFCQFLTQLIPLPVPDRRLIFQISVNNGMSCHPAYEFIKSSGCWTSASGRT
jgi:hypothetical protein